MPPKGWHNTNPRWSSAQVKRLIKKLKLTNREFAHMFGVGLRTVASWRNGQNSPLYRNQRQLDRIEKQLNLKRIALKG